MRTVFALLFVCLIPFCAYSTPIAIEGTYITPVGNADGLPGTERFLLGTGEKGYVEVAFNALVSPQGGAYRASTGTSYFRTMASIALNLLDAGGNLLGQIAVSGRSYGFEAEGFALSQSLVLKCLPSSVELFFEGHDARIDWSVGFTIEEPFPKRIQAEIPEPATVFGVGMAGVVLAARRRGKRIRTLP